MSWSQLSVCRFLLSLSDCTQCIVLDDQLNVLPISSHVLSLLPVPPRVCAVSMLAPSFHNVCS